MIYVGIAIQFLRYFRDMNYEEYLIRYQLWLERLDKGSWDWAMMRTALGTMRPSGIYFYNEEDAVAFKLEFGL